MEFYKLTTRQQKALDLIAGSKFAPSFVFSGGTALSSVYLQHRFSEDLDFFSEEEFDAEQLLRFLNSFKSKIGFDSITFRQSWNRFLYFFNFFDGDVLKIEFDYYPFTSIEKGKIYKKLRIDSLIDIATNKLYTISVKARSRDFIDLFYIYKKRSFSISELYYLAKQKFDTHIDPLQLGAQLTAFDPSDMTMLYKPVPEDEIRHFFETQANSLAEEILSP